MMGKLTKLVSAGRFSGKAREVAQKGVDNAIALFESTVGPIDDVSSSSGSKKRNPELRTSIGERNKRHKNAAERKKPGPKPKQKQNDDEMSKNGSPAKRTKTRFHDTVYSSDPSSIGRMVHPEDSSNSMISKKAFDASPTTIDFLGKRLI